MKKMLRFDKVHDLSCEYHWIVMNHKGECLGQIVPHDPWRCMVYEPIIGIIMSRSCLLEVCEFMDEVETRDKSRVE